MNFCPMCVADEPAAAALWLIALQATLVLQPALWGLLLPVTVRDSDQLLAGQVLWVWTSRTDPMSRAMCCFARGMAKASHPCRARQPSY
jgi:hypothetical protein